LAPIGGHAQPVTEVMQLPQGIRGRLSCWRRIFRSALSVRKVARAAAAPALVHETCRAVLDDVGHRRVVAGKPVDDVVAVTNINERVSAATTFDVLRTRLLG